tara:strand:- start:207 stop:1757 length:1551 start_codon:yes stop_codon:yes gene_type:complete
MASVALQNTTVEQLNKIIEVVGKKSFALVDGIKTAVAPQLNQTIAKTIDDFQKGGLKKQNRAIDDLQAQMRKLGVSVDDLTGQFNSTKDIPAGLKSLQAAMRFREDTKIKAEAEVETLRKQGISARVQQVGQEFKPIILTQKEVVKEQKVLAKEQDKLLKEERTIQKEVKQLSKISNEKERIKESVRLAEKSKALEEKKEENLKKQQELQTDQSGVRGAGGQQDLNPMMSGIGMQLEGIVDSIKSPFVEIGNLAAGIGKTFMSFGKALLTPIKSLKLFGASVLATTLSFLPIILIILAVVVALTVIMFKFQAIKDGVTKYGGMLIDYFKNLPKMLKEKWDAFTAYIGGIKDALKEKWDALVDSIASFGDRIWSSIKGAFGKVGDYIADIFKGMYNALANSKIGKLFGMEPVALSSDTGSVAPKQDDGANIQNATSDKIKEQQNENSIDATKNKFATDDKKVLQDGSMAGGNTNIITVQQNNPQTNTQNVGSTGMITQGNGDNPEKGSVYENISKFA